MASILLTIGEPILSDVISRLVDKATTSDFLHFVRKENLEALIPSCCSSFSLSNVKFGSKLKDITTRLEEIVKQKNDLGLTEKPYTKLEKRNATPSLTFLIVVDDVWNDNVYDWETLCLPFRTGVDGCKILVTTRNKFDMTTMNVTPHHLKQPSVEDCVSIMQDYALGEMGVGEAYSKAENVRHFSFVSSRYDIFKRFKNISELKQLRTFLALYRGIEERYSGAHTLSYDVLHTILPELKCLKNIINLTELHKLDLDGTKNLLEMPSRMRSLTKLQTLSKFIVSKGDKNKIRELQGLTRLRGKLSIYGLDNVQDIKDVRSANLKGKEGLDDIALIWSNEFYDSRNAELEMQVLDLLEPNKNLKVLKIESYGGNEFSSWIGNPCFANLERVTLLRCKKCKSLPSLGRLPLLKYMCIKGNDGVERVGHECFSGSKSFPMLDTLEFDNMHKLMYELKNTLVVGHLHHMECDDGALC
ncbi:hypothetical protein ACFE04_009065 [Oxalis oulophora]